MRRIFEVLVALAAPRSVRQSVLGDLEEDYRRALSIRGRRAATLWYAREAVLLSLRYSLERWRGDPDRPSASMAGGLVTDLEQAIRGLVCSPGFAILAIAMLAVGIAVSVCTYGLIDAVLFRPLSAFEPERLVRLGTLTASAQSSSRFAFSYSDYRDVRSRARTITSVTPAALTPFLLRIGDDPSEILGEVVSGEYFAMLHVHTSRGRVLGSADDVAGAPPAAVISSRAAEKYFAGRDPLGSTVALSNHPYTVVGILPADFGGTFVAAPVDVWITTASADGFFRRDWRTNRTDRQFALLARLAPGVTRLQAQAELDTISAELGRASPDVWRDVRLQLLDADLLTGGLRQSALMFAAILGGMAALVLAIVCTNVLNLLLVRSVAVRRQTAIRIAMGAGTRRVVAPQMIECLILAGAAGAGAVAMTAVLMRFLSSFEVLPTLTIELGLRLDRGVLLLSACIAVAAGLLLGLVPAIDARRLDPQHFLRDDSRTAAGSRRGTRLRSALVIAQIAASVLLLSCAGLFARSLINSTAADLGFRPERAAAVDVDLSARDLSMTDAHHLYDELYRRLKGQPAMVAVAFSNRAPIDRSTPTVNMITGAPSAGDTYPQATMYLASPEYFEAISMPLVRGRTFTDSDHQKSARVAIVNQTLAERFWPGQDAVGMFFRTAPDGPDIRVVGVAPNSRYRTPGESPLPHVYLPFAQSDGQFATVIARSAGNPAIMIPVIQRELERLPVPLQGFFGRTLVNHLRPYRLPAEFAATLAAVLGVLALLLASTGLYGLIAYVVRSRAAEIAIRMALGASPERIRAEVIGTGVWLLIPGAAIGLAGAVAVGYFASSILFGIGVADGGSIVAAVGVIAVAVLTASYLPAHRAMRIDPVDVLRR